MYTLMGVKPGLLIGKGDMIASAESHLKGKRIDISLGSSDKSKYSGNDVFPKFGSKRSITYVAGASGSGKSFFACRLAKEFKRQHPKSNIYLFSRTPWEDDVSYKGLNPIQIPMNQSLVNEPLDLSEIESGSMVLFDDTGSHPNKNIRGAVNDLMVEICEIGRKYNIHAIITSHLINPNDKSIGRILMNELTSIVVFPAGSFHQISYCFKTYLGLTKKQIEQCVDTDSRWICIMKNYPQLLIDDESIRML